MSPQLLWTIAGLILTVLTLGGVSISSYQSVDASTAKLIASEAGNIGTASKLWVANKSTDGTYNGIAADAMSASIPDLTLSGTGAASRLASKAATGVNYAVASVTPFNQVVITVAGMTTTQTPLVQAALTGKACTVANVSTTSASYTCNI